MSDCIFCRIASGEIPAKIIRRSDTALAFFDLGPQAPTHALIIPVQHFGSVDDLRSEAGELVAGHLVRFAAEVARELGLAEDGYRLVANTGRNGGQSVFHLHFHLLGGRPMTWPPG